MRVRKGDGWYMSLTREEIADHFNIPVEDLEIVG